MYFFNPQNTIESSMVVDFDDGWVLQAISRVSWLGIEFWLNWALPTAYPISNCCCQSSLLRNRPNLKCLIDFHLYKKSGILLPLELFFFEDFESRLTLYSLHLQGHFSNVSISSCSITFSFVTTVVSSSKRKTFAVGTMSAMSDYSGSR